MTTWTRPFGPASLRIDAELETAKISASLNDYLARSKRRGVVVALSGGIDSSTVAAICVAALGKERVFGLHMPERESSSDTIMLSRLVADSLGIDSALEEISPILEAAGCYKRRADAIRKVCPDYGPGYKSKIVLPSVIDSDSFRLYSVVVMAPDGTQTKHRLTPEAYLGIVAATNFKQRVRKMFEYYHADRLNYAVSGTPNRLEYKQGFFVKNGDGSADVKPIAHLYKTQVYALARHFDLPREICEGRPTTDTYTLDQGQDEFYFALPYEKMDLALYALNNGFSAEDLAPAIGVDAERAALVYRDIRGKRSTTRPLHLRPQLIRPVPEVA